MPAGRMSPSSPSPPSGLPLAAAVARDLRVPLTSVPVQVIQAAGFPAQVIGAVAAGGTACLDGPLIRALGLPEPVVHALVLEARWELVRQDGVAGTAAPARFAPGTTFIVVDAGVVTGRRLRAVLAALRPLYAGRVVVAVPELSQAAQAGLQPEVDELVCLQLADLSVALS